MPFNNRRGGRGRGGKNFNNRNPNKFFRRNPNRPGGIRKDFQDFGNRPPLRPTNRPLNKRTRGGRRRNEGTDNRQVPKKNNGKFSADNLDKQLASYWGKDHKETRERILNDDLESYWEKKPSKQEKTENEQPNQNENKVIVPHQEVPKPVEHHPENFVLAKKKNEVPL